MRARKVISLFVGCLLTVTALCGCEILPASGPYPHAIKAHPVNKTVEKKSAVEAIPFEYALVEIDKKVEDSYRKIRSRDPSPWPLMGAPNVRGVSVGDTVSVTIFESQSGGLFIPKEAGSRSGNFVNIPSQIVDPSGTINVPFAGEIKVAGRSTVEIGNEISQKLGSRAIEPQAIVSITERRGAEVSVIGAVNGSTKFTLGYNGEKLLDAIARAGGPSSPAYETNITLQREGREWRLPFDVVIDDPGKNIFLRPGDTVYLEREAKSYQIYGAVGAAGAHDFQKADITLSEALGAAKGLNDDKADPSEVYLYREQDAGDLEKLGVSLKSMASAVPGRAVPVIYTLNLRDVRGFFLAQKFDIQDQDIIYVANSEASEFRKFLDLLNPTSVTKINTQNAIEQ